MRYTLEQGLLNQSFHGQAPAVRALLDDSLLIEAVRIEEHQLLLQFNPQFLPDLQLAGLHRLQLHAGDQQVEALIKIAPQTQQDLMPLIEQVELVEQNGQPQYLKVIGRHFFLNGGWTQVFIDERPVNTGVTSILTDGQAEIIVDLSQLGAYDPQVSHQLRYQSPLGTTIYSF